MSVWVTHLSWKTGVASRTAKGARFIFYEYKRASVGGCARKCSSLPSLQGLPIRAPEEQPSKVGTRKEGQCLHNLKLLSKRKERARTQNCTGESHRVMWSESWVFFKACELAAKPDCLIPSPGPRRGKRGLYPTGYLLIPMNVL